MKAAPFFPLALIVGLLILCGLPRAAQAACAAPVGTAGTIGYNATAKTFQYCNGTNWVRMTKPGSGSGGCTNPTLAEGKLGYNQDFRTLQGCAGNVHRTAGVVGGG